MPVVQHRCLPNDKCCDSNGTGDEVEAENAPEGGFTSHPAVSVTSSKCEHTTPPLRHMIDVASDVASRITHHACTAPHETCLSEKILIKADDAPDQVGCCDSLEWMISSVTYLNTALEAAQHNVVAVSGDATGYPEVMSSWSGTHPDAVSFRIWSQAPVTPRPLGDDLKWSNDHEIYQAPSPTFDPLLQLTTHCRSSSQTKRTLNAQSVKENYHQTSQSLLYLAPSKVKGRKTRCSKKDFEVSSLK